jgi:hypothetical protein
MLNDPDVVPPAAPDVAPEKPASGPAQLPTPVDRPLELAHAHRGMMWCFALKFGVDFMANSAKLLMPEVAYYLFMAFFLAVSLTTAYFTFRAARVMYGTGPAVVCACLIFAPCIGTFTVLILSGNAIDHLRKLGVKGVGLMGATVAQLEELKKPA